MRIKKLTIHNIASIEDATIDFDKAPLENSPLFLICGETGTGKTTILNSICLALYSEVPSLENVGSAVYDSENVRTDNPVQLMRKGTGEAFASLWFEGNDGKNYKADWNIRRARNKATGKIQEKSRSLTCEDTQIQMTKANDINDEIVRIVGLNFDQFCRTTMLAQGQFSEFLKGTDDEKVQILEKLTGTEIYEKIGSKIHDLYTEKDKEHDSLSDEIKGTEILDDEQVKTFNDQIETKRKDVEELSKESARLKGIIDWFEQYGKLNEENEGAKKNLAAAEATLKSEETIENSKAISDWDKTGDVRADLKRRTELQGLLDGKKNDLAGKQETFKSLLEGLNWLENQLTEMKNRFANLQDKINAVKPNEPMFNELGGIKAHIKTIIDKREEVKNLSIEIAKIEKSISDLDAQKEQAGKSFEDATEKRKNQEEATKALSEKLKGTDIETLSRTVAQDSDTIHSIETAITAVTASLDKDADHKEAVAALKNLNAQKEEARKSKEEDEKILPSLVRDFNDLDSRYQGQQTLKDHIIELRKSFEDTAVCPLCGSNVSGLHTEDVLDNEVRKAKEAAEAAKSELEKKREDVHKTEAFLKTLEDSIKKAQADEERKQAALKMSVEAAIAATSTLKVDSSSDTALNLLNTLKSNALAKKEKDSEALFEANRQRKEYDAANSLLQKVGKDLEKAKDEKQRLIEKSNDYSAEKSVKLNLSAQATDDAGKAMAELKEKVTLTVDWGTADLRNLGERISGMAKEYADDKASADRLSRQISDTEKDIRTAKTDIEEVKGRFPEVSQTGENRKMESLVSVLGDFVNQVNTLNGSIETADHQLRETSRRIDDYLGQHTEFTVMQLVKLSAISESEIDKRRKEIEAIRGKKSEAEGELKRLNTQINVLVQNKPQTSEDDSDNSLKAKKDGIDSKIEDLKKELSGIETRLKLNEESLAKVAEKNKKLKALRTERDNWHLLDNIFGGDKGSKFRRIAQSYVLRALLVKANYYLSQLFNRYELVCTDGQLAINVRDRNQGNAIRNVASLSGGETFIVSLALALGLSSINKDNIRIDTLFIDEGFGTLSDDYLDTVIEVLDRLHSLGGSKVGLISHVEKLRERITTRIQLERTGSSSSTVKVVPNYSSLT